MYLYTWRKRTPIALGLADHTWVTSYDLRVHNYHNITQVIHAQECYWYSRGDFHTHGDFIGRVNYDSIFANCLVPPNDKVKGNGSIIRYGIDGVCHQVSNQVLYRSRYPSRNLRVNKARGYKLSSAIFGTYGLNNNRWAKNKKNCFSSSFFNMTKSLITIRANNFSKNNNIDKSIMKYLEAERLILLNFIEIEGTAVKGLLESKDERVEKMNLLIFNYLLIVSSSINEQLYKYIFGLDPGIRMDIIDVEEFTFSN